MQTSSGQFDDCARRLAIVLLLCCHCPAVTAQRSPAITRHADVVPEHGGILVLALGDSLRVVARAYRCTGDVCMIDSVVTTSAWMTESRGISVSPLGILRARKLGVFVLRKRVNGLVAQDSVTVLPPIGRIAWTARPRTLRVGDTLRVGLVARDSGGTVVYHFGASEHISGTNRSGEILWWNQAGMTGLLVNRVGLIELVGWLAQRSDTLRIRVVERAVDVDPARL